MTLLDNHHVAYPDLQLFPPKCMGCRYHNTPLLMTKEFRVRLYLASVF